MSVADARPSWTLLLLPAAILLGGLRDPHLAALGEAAVFVAVWSERPALGPSLFWMPWLAWAAVSALLSAQPLAALPVLARWSAVLAFASLAAQWTARDREDWLKVLLVVAEVLALAALATGGRLDVGWRMSGLIPPYYNYTAFALAAAGGAGAAWAFHPRASGRAARAAGLTVASLCAACILRAHSRGALLGLGAAATIWALRRWGGRMVWAIAVAAAVCFMLFGVAPVRRFVLKSDRRYEESRPGIWRAAARVAATRPVLGVGPGSFAVGFAAGPVAVENGPARWGLSTDYAHSEPLQAAAETGWVGLALWLTGLGAILWTLMRRSSDVPAREAAAVAVAAMLPQILMDNILQLPGLAMLFFSAAVVAAEPMSVGRRWPRAAAAAGAALALTAWIPRALGQSSLERAAALFPAEAGPREDLAYRAMARGRLADADRFWRQAAARAPFDAIYPWRRAQIAAAQKRWADAEEESATAIGLEPGFSNARVLHAEALARQGRSAAARAELAEVLIRREAVSGAPSLSGYDEAIADLDAKEFARVSGLAAARR